MNHAHISQVRKRRLLFQFNPVPPPLPRFGLHNKSPPPHLGHYTSRAAAPGAWDNAVARPCPKPSSSVSAFQQQQGSVFCRWWYGLAHHTAHRRRRGLSVEEGWRGAA